MLKSIRLGDLGCQGIPRPAGTQGERYAWTEAYGRQGALGAHGGPEFEGIEPSVPLKHDRIGELFTSLCFKLPHAWSKILFCEY